MPNLLDSGNRTKIISLLQTDIKDNLNASPPQSCIIRLLERWRVRIRIVLVKTATTTTKINSAEMKKAESRKIEKANERCSAEYESMEGGGGVLVVHQWVTMWMCVIRGREWCIIIQSVVACGEGNQMIEKPMIPLLPGIATPESTPVKL